jgi:hypothetical protein
VAVAELTAFVELIEAAWAIPVAFVAGVLAVVLSRRALRRVERTIGRVGGETAARAGRLFGALGIAISLSGAIAIAVYWYLEHIAS